MAARPGAYKKPSVPRSSGYGKPRPVGGYQKPVISTSRVPKSACPKPKSTEARSVKPQFTIPALSLPFKPLPPDPTLERLKKKTIRRNVPQGEDIKKIRQIIRSINREVCTVQEFIGLVSPFTGDGGNALRTVLGDDLSSFRKMAKRVYDTMTQDVSDVLANEQIYLTNFYNERYNVFHFKMMRTMDEIHRYVPDFDFNLYYKDKAKYLNNLFPIADEQHADPEEEEMQQRHLLYHRLEWLRSEGSRLNDENHKLQNRLKQLKQQQRDELFLSKQKEEIAEDRKIQLEAAEANLQNQLEELNDSVHKSIVINEESLRIEEESNLQQKLSQNQGGRSRSREKPQKSETWSAKAAKDIEKESFNKTAAAAMSSASASVTSTVSKKIGKKKIKSKFKRPPRVPREGSPGGFHYSPPRSPPKVRERSPSPFHYSPPRAPQGSSALYGSQPAEASSVETIRVESTNTVVGESNKVLPPPRANRAPRDAWGGFI